MADGTDDCGNGGSCSGGKKCSQDRKHCLDQNTVDCGSHFCEAGNRCGSNNSCLERSAVDCGNGKSCGQGQLCRPGGGCATPEQLAAEQAAEQEKWRVAAEEKREEVARQKAAMLEGIQEAKEAARLKQEERQRLIAQQKAGAEAKKAEEKRLQDEVAAAARKKKEDDLAAALKAAQDKVAVQRKLLEEQQEITRLEKEAQQLAAETKDEQAMRAKAVPTGSAAATAVNSNGSLSNASPSHQPLTPIPQISSAKPDKATLQRMANDPNELPAAQNLATALLASEYGPTTKAASLTTNAGVFGSTPAKQPAQPDREVQALAQKGASTVYTAGMSSTDLARAVLNDPNQSLSSRQVAAFAFGLDPTKITQETLQGGSANSSDAKSATTIAGTQESQDGAQPIKLNADTRNDIVSLSSSGGTASRTVAGGLQSSSASTNIGSVGTPSTFQSPVALGALTPAGTSIATTSPTQASGLWDRVESAYSIANKVADTQPAFVQSAANISGEITLAEKGAAIGWQAAGPLGVIDGAIIGAKIYGVAGNVHDAQSVLTDVAKGNTIGGLREAVSIGTDKLADKGGDMLLDNATGGAGVASPISLSSAIKVDASWGTDFLVAFFRNPSGH